MRFVCHFHLFLSCHVWVIYAFIFVFVIHSCMPLFNSLKKVRKDKIPKLLQRRGSTSPKFPEPDLTENKELKMRKINITWPWERYIKLYEKRNKHAI